MRSENDITAAGDYAGTGATPPNETTLGRGQHVRHERGEPKTLVELVVVRGPEGQKLHAIQAEVIRRILMRLAERQTQVPQKESGP
jgi:hypothetical protein